MSHRHLPASTSTLIVDIRGAEILDEDESNEPSDIYLPKHTEFISHIALDIGGSLAKIVYFTRPANLSASRENYRRDSSGHSPDYTQRISNPDQHQSQDQSQNFPSHSSCPASSNSTVSSDLEPHNISGSGPHSSARSSVSQANGILDPTVVREKVYNRRSLSNYNITEDSDSLSLLDFKDDNQQGLYHAESLDFINKDETFLKSSPISSIPGGSLHFVKFETGCIESECIPFISDLIKVSAESNGVTITTMKHGVKIIVTGGGAYMYADLIKSALGGDVEVLKEDEMDCLITGLNFITKIPKEVFWFSDELVQEIIHNSSPNPSQQEDLMATSRKTKEAIDSSSSDPILKISNLSIDQLPRPSPNPPLYSVLFDSNPAPQFPFMLVNIGSGVSIIKVTDFGKFERISGTSLGGGTLWGLLSLLTNAQSFDEMLDLSIKGDNSKVDMLVGDIYGQDYGKIGLKSSTIASSFGKVFKKNSNLRKLNQDLTCENANNNDANVNHFEKKNEFTAQDISKSLLYAISNNIGQIAHLNAEKHGLDRIYFGGCFIRGHAATVSTLSYAIRFWSQGKKRAFFLRHEGYLGSIGAWLKNIGQAYDQDYSTI